MNKRAVLLANLGSPCQPDSKAVRRYLNQFLMDRHVIQLPWLIRRLIVGLFVLPFRPAQSAKAYKKIWTKEGSPLIVLSKRLQTKLQAELDMPVGMAMRYGEPSIGEQMLHLAQQQDISEILFMPLYPHYADSTVTTSIHEAQIVIKKHKLPVNLTVFPPFYDHPDYIHALVKSAQLYLDKRYDHILFSYHGLPESHLANYHPSGYQFKEGMCCQGDNDDHKNCCYRYHVFRTTACFADKAGLKSSQYSIAFQSRLGRAKWLEPSTENTLRKLATSGVSNLLIICPAFVTDCLETLEEIAIGGQEIFQSAGGKSFTFIPCLNDHPAWINTLAEWCQP